MKILLFRLEGFLQSWGEHSSWTNRDTAYIPTKSGIIGILSSCLGYHRNDSRIKALNDALSIGIRVDRQGEVIRDYHTVQGSVEIGPNRTGFKNAQRKIRLGGNTIVSNRYYLEDASFLVAVAGEESLLKQVDKAMCHPMHVAFLGRKACLPSVPLIPIMKEYESLEDALKCEAVCDRNDGTVLPAEFDYGTDAGKTYGYRTDAVQSFANRTFNTRKVIRKNIKVETEA